MSSSSSSSDSSDSSDEGQSPQKMVIDDGDQEGSSKIDENVETAERQSSDHNKSSSDSSSDADTSKNQKEQQPPASSDESGSEKGKKSPKEVENEVENKSNSGSSDSDHSPTKKQRPVPASSSDESGSEKGKKSPKEVENEVDENKSDSGSGSSDSDHSPTKKQRPVPASSSDESGSDKEKKSSPKEVRASSESDKSPAAQIEAMKSTERDLFGDADDLSSSDDEEKRKRKQKDLTEADVDPDEIIGPRLYHDEDTEEPIAPQETVIEVEAPRISVDLGSSGAYFVKFPNFLSVEPRPFDPMTYEDEIDEDEVLDEEGRSRLKLKVENTIRWRDVMDDNGAVTKESNAKILRWSDGTMSLYLGEEIFDIHMQPVQDHNHLFVRQGAGLQGQSVFRTKLTFRPHSTDSQTHRKMTLSMADRSNKAQKVKVLPSVGKNPETEKQELVRKEEERLRASIRRESQQRRQRERLAGHGGGLSAGYLEPDRDFDSGEEGESLSAIKRSYKPGGKEFDRLARASNSDSDFEQKPEHSAKKLSDSEESFSGDEKRKTKKKIVIEDSD